MKKGDKVICVNDKASFGRLFKGEIYTVSEAYDGTLTVESRGAYHCLDRFEEILEEKEKMKVVKQNNLIKIIGEEEFLNGEETYKNFLIWREKRGDSLEINPNLPFSFHEISSEEWDNYCKESRYKKACLEASK